ncbi:MAG: lipopolysaccharide heptosyltransferase II, partial [Vicinamibacterales bacterium]
APNWLGDAVMALPAIADVRQSASRSALIIAARPSVAPLFTMVPGVDEIVELDARRSLAHDVDAIRRVRADAAVLLPNSFRTAMMVWRAGVQERWGYRTSFRGALLTFAPPAPSEVHQATYYQRLTTAIGASAGPRFARLDVGDGNRRAAHALLTELGWDGGSPLVALAPGAAYGTAKRWAPSSYAELASAVSRDGGLPVIVGGPADRDAGVEVISALKPDARAANLIGRTDLQTLAGVLALCRTLVSNDSGAMHVASAVGTPVTALFGPTDETATHPVGAGSSRVLTHPVWCRPCMLRDCPLDHRCMTGIRVEAVLDAVRSSV